MFVFLLLENVMFWIVTHRLINKVMSGNYYAYSLAENLQKPQTIVAESQVGDMPENIEALSDFG
jgi:hypothetical protein